METEWRGMINHDDLAAFQIQTDYTGRFVATSVMWSLKMTPGIRKPGCGAQCCQSVVGWGGQLFSLIIMLLIVGVSKVPVLARRASGSGAFQLQISR